MIAQIHIQNEHVCNFKTEPEGVRERKSFNTLLINPRFINIISFVLVYKTVNIEQMKKAEAATLWKHMINHRK